MSNDTVPPPTRENQEKNLRIVRVIGVLTGLTIIGFGLHTFYELVVGTFVFPTLLKGIFYCIFGTLLSLPWFKLRSSPHWLKLYIALASTSLMFVFVTIFTVMFAYIEAMERGEKLGIPGLEGTLIFLALMQTPAVLFIKKPNLLD